MERTFLSTLNQSFYLMFIGAGMMAINDFDVVARNFRASVVVRAALLRAAMTAPQSASMPSAYESFCHAVPAARWDSGSRSPPPSRSLPSQVSGILYAGLSYSQHVTRLALLKEGGLITTRRSNCWLGVLMLLTFFASISELAYMFVYPLLDRAKTVELTE